MFPAKKRRRRPITVKVLVKLSDEELDAFTEEWRERELDYYRVFWVIADGWHDDPVAYREQLKQKADKLKTMTLAKVRKLKEYKEYAREYHPKESKLNV